MMRRRAFLASGSGAAALAGVAPGAGRRNTPLANDFVLVWRSPQPGRIAVGTPGMTRLPDGRLVATFQINTPSKNWPGAASSGAELLKP